MSPAFTPLSMIDAINSGMIISMITSPTIKDGVRIAAVLYAPTWLNIVVRRMLFLFFLLKMSPLCQSDPFPYSTADPADRNHMLRLPFTIAASYAFYKEKTRLRPA
jgi:hypothetical protein